MPECDMCGHWEDTQHQLTAHRNAAHPVCPQCGVQFIHPGALNNHLAHAHPHESESESESDDDQPSPPKHRTSHPPPIKASHSGAHPADRVGKHHHLNKHYLRNKKN